jgi:hypothetical protein
MVAAPRLAWGLGLMGETVTVDALLREPTAAEVTEGLERNPGSTRLAERGWQPLWFDVWPEDVGERRLRVEVAAG